MLVRVFGSWEYDTLVYLWKTYKDAHRAGLANFPISFHCLVPRQAVEPKLLIWSNPDKKHRRRRKVTALNQPRSRQLVLDVRVVDRSSDQAGDAKGGLQDDHGKQ